MTTITGTQGNWAVDLVIDEVATDPIYNTSTVNWELRLRTLSGSSWIGGDPYVTISISGKVALSATIPVYFGSASNPSVTIGGVRVQSGTVTGIEHNDNGTIKSNSVSFGWSGQGFTPNDVHASGTYPAAIIQRRSIVGATRAYVGENTSITVTRYVETFTHKIAYSIGEESGYILRDGTLSNTEDIMSTLNLSLEIPDRWYSEITSTEADCTLTITTYNGTLQIGTPYTTTFKVLINPAESAPVVTTSVYDLNDDMYALTGSRTTLVKNFSEAQLTWSATARHDATITSTTLNGEAITTSPTTFYPINSAIQLAATDSRGFVTVASPEFTFIDYDFPTCNGFGYRVAPTSNDTYVQFSGNWWVGNFGAENNSIQISWSYKEDTPSETNWWYGGALTEGTDYTISGGTFWSGTGLSAATIQLNTNVLDYNKQWLVGIDVYDKVTGGSATITVPVGIPIIDWEGDFVNVNGDIRQYNESIIDRFGYSTTETLVGQYNGSPLYRQVITFTSYAGENYITLGNYISNLDEIITISGSVKQVSTNNKTPVQYYYSSSDYCMIFYSPSNDRLRIRCGSSYGFGDMKIILEYTKTSSI